MATWQDTCTFMVREYVGDPDGDTYTDGEIVNKLIVAAKYVALDVPLVRKTYVIDIEGLTITPDPAAEPEDAPFLILLSLKTACLLDGMAVRNAAGSEGVTAKLGPANISVKGKAASLQKIQDGPNSNCALYAKAKIEYMTGADILPYRSALTPYSSDRTNTNIGYGDAYY